MSALEPTAGRYAKCVEMKTDFKKRTLKIQKYLLLNRAELSEQIQFFETKKVSSEYVLPAPRPRSIVC